MENREKDNSQRFNAFIKLCLWGIFIVFILLISSLGSNKDNNINKEETSISYEEKLNKLNNNFKYNYEIKVNNEVYNFAGSKLLDKEVGSRIYKEETINYYVENDKSYLIENNELKDLDTLYQNLDKNIFDVNVIKQEIKGKEYLKSNDKYSYILDDNKIIYIYSDNKNITKIEIFIASDYYKLEFSEIGLIKEINY